MKKFGHFFWGTGIAFILLWFVAAIQVSAGSNSEIRHLLDYIKSSDCSFIRNGKQYSGEEAYKHLKRKLDYAGDSIQSAEEFIDRIATKSSISGEFYRVCCDDRQILNAEWLKKELLKLRSTESGKSGKSAGLKTHGFYRF